MSTEIQREYYVILKRYEDLDDFYTDMETEGGDLYIPNRCVACTDRGPDSRVTKYMLTDEEAQLVAQDPRVAAVELNYTDAGVKILPMSPPPVQTSSQWDKSDTVTSTMLNWGLPRTVLGRPTLTGTNKYPDAVGYTSDLGTGHYTNRPVNFTFLSYNELVVYTKTGVGNTWVRGTNYWDIVGVTPQSGNAWGVYGTFYKTAIQANIQLNSTGKNVDVVVVDGGIVNPAHPEFQRNADGTGGTRVIQYNWYQHNAELGKGPNGNYSYDLSRVDAHATHCTGTVAGITQGWAKEANIYNIDFNVVDLFRYVRAFHRNKPINPLTGRKNPTVCTNSWGTFSGSIGSNARISKVVHNAANNATIFNRPSGSSFTNQQLFDWGIISVTSNMYLRSPALDADYRDAIDDGIICISAAGNSSFWISSNTGLTIVPGTLDANTVTLDGVPGENDAPNGTYYYLRGPSPSADMNIRVGALDIFPWDFKASFSSTGPGVDIYAPGYNIMSSYLNAPNINPAVADSRNGQFYLQKLQGTSMATPQVAGVIACLAEHFPHWSNLQFDWYLTQLTNEYGSISESTYTSTSPFRFYQILGEDNPNKIERNGWDIPRNKILRYYKQRPDTGVVWPRQTYTHRFGIPPVHDPGPVKKMYPRPRLGRK